MMSKEEVVTRRARFLAPAALVVLAAAVAACEGPDSAQKTEPYAEAEQPFVTGLGKVKHGDPTARLERRFLESQMDHHAGAIGMSQVCVERAVHEELRELCAHMIEVQTAENAQMGEWLSDWYGVEHEPHVMPKDQENIAQLASLEGSELEQEFLGDMVQHHMMGASRADTCALLAAHKPLVEMCETQAMEQPAEADMMETWLREWYLECPKSFEQG